MSRLANREMLRAKIHRPTVTETNVNYEGSLTLDVDLMRAAGMVPYERCEVYNCDNGHRFSTYLIVGRAGSGQVCVNGAAARLAHVGDRIIIATYATIPEEEVAEHRPTVVLVDSKNTIRSARVDGNQTAPEGSGIHDKPFLSDMMTLRDRIREDLERVASHPGRAGRDTVIRILNEALTTEIVRVLRCWRHYFMAKETPEVARELLRHANAVQSHADRIAQRIVQLGGTPGFTPEGLLTRSPSITAQEESLGDQIREDILGGRIASEGYREVVDSLGSTDATTRRMLEDIIAEEATHAADLAAILEVSLPGSEPDSIPRDRPASREP